MVNLPPYGIFVLVALAWFLMPSPLDAKVLGTFGNTYAISEPDFLEEIRERALRVDWEKEFEKLRERVVSFRPGGLVSLPRAVKDRTFTVDMTYELEFDITDASGNVIYPKGFRFNPLEYVYLRETLVVIDGDDPGQVKWFERKWNDRPDVMLLLTGGSYYELSRKLLRPVYYASERIVKKFRLSHVPSVVRQAGNVMEVKEIYVPPEK